MAIGVSWRRGRSRDAPEDLPTLASCGNLVVGRVPGTREYCNAAKASVHHDCLLLDV